MRTLLFGFIFGLLAVIHSSPITNVTQMPTEAEDGSVIDSQGLTSESPEKNTTVSASQQTSPVSDEKDFEGSASGEPGDLFPLHVGEHFTTATTPSATSQETSTALHVTDFEGSASGESGDLVPLHVGKHFTTTATATTTSATSQETSPVSHVTDFEGSASGESSGMFPHDEGERSTTPTTTTAASQQTSTVPGEKVSEASASGESSVLHPHDEGHSTTSPTLPAPVGPRGSRMFGIFEDSGDSAIKGTQTDESPASDSIKKDDKGVNSIESQKGDTEMHKGHTTPGWIIIVAFIVALAALIMICVAIATRDKWNRPNQAPVLENTANSTNQQKEQEMETFLPKENGKSSEYTVIPLDELPEKYSSD